MKKVQFRYLLLSGIAAYSAMPTLAQAQQADDTAVSSGSDIVVTARRRGEDIAKVPTTIAAINADSLEQRSIATQADLQASVPGLTVRETQSNQLINYAIRGQTVDAFSGSSTAVVPYVNEVPFTAGGIASFFDLDSVQVLKGPQGTLFGRNATGGAVLSTTARPKDSLSGSVKLGIGNYDAKSAEFMFNAPVVEDKLLLRVAAKLSRRDGYIRNVFPGPVYGGNDNSELGALHSDALRASILFRPADGIENLTVVQHERTKGNNSGVTIYDVYRCGQTGPSGIPLACAAAFVFPGVIAALDRQRNNLGFWEVNGDAPSFHRGRDTFATNTTTIELGENTRLKNIFGYSSSKILSSMEQTGEPFLLITNYDISRPVGANPSSYGNDVANKSLSNEIQLQGKFEGAFDYILGLYYQKIKNHTIFPQTYFGGGAFTTSDWKSNDTTKAIFGHISVDMGEVANLDGLKFTLGGRYAWEKITNVDQPGGTFFGADLSTPFKDDRASWNVGLEYQATPNLMLYATARESWRSGGINGVSPAAVRNDLGVVVGTDTDKFKSEVAQDFEGGLKYAGSVNGTPMHLYLSAYTMSVKNIQRVLFPDNPFTASPDSFANTVNVPRARIKGLEFDLGIKPLDVLELGLNGAYTKATYTRNQAILFAGAAQQLRFDFGPFADSPKWTGSAYAVVNLPIPEDAGNLRLRGDIYRQSSFYFSNLANTIDPGTKLPSYSLVNFRLDWQDIMGTGIGIGAWVRNAFKEKYYVGGLSQGLSFGTTGANIGRPRMYGIDLKAVF